MTLRLGLQIDGDASGAKKALGDTARGLDDVDAASRRQGKSSQDSGKESEQQARRIKDVAEALQFEAAQIARTSEQQAIHNALRRAGASLASTEGQAIARLAAANDNARAAKERAERASLKNNESIEKLARVASVAGGQVGGLVGQVGGLVIGASRLGVGVAAAVIALGLLSVGAYKAVTAYAALETQQARTANVLAARGAGAPRAETVSSAGSAAARVGTHTLEDIRAAEHELARFSEVSDEAFTRTLANAQRLSNLGFVPLKEAASAFGEAFRDPVASLQQLEAAGLRFSAAQKDVVQRLVESGQAQKATAEIERIAAEQLSGANTKSANTLSAAHGRLGNAVEEAKEHVGGWIARVFALKEITDLAAVGVDRLTRSTKDYNANQRVAEVFRGPMLVPPAEADGWTKAKQDRLDNVSNALKRQTEAARESEVAQAQLAARRLAGVDAINSENVALAANARAIDRQVGSLHEAQFAQAARAAFITQSSALRTEAATLDAAAGAAAAYKYEQEKLADAKAKGLTLGAQTIAQLREEAAAIGGLTQNTANLRLERELTFERAQLGRSTTEARVFQELRGAGVDGKSAEGARLADTIRLNEALKTTKELSADLISGGLKDFRQQIANGANAWDAFKSAGLSALDRLSDKLIDMATQNLVAKALGSGSAGGGGGIFGLISSLFGGGGASVSDPTFGGFTAAGASAASVKFDVGGYTGDADRRAVAGVVHGREFVFDAEKTARYRPLFEAIHRGARVPGYAGGGYVGSAPMAPPSSTAGFGAPVVHVHPAAPGETFDARVGSDGQLVLVGRMIRQGIDDFARRELPEHISAFAADPRRRS